MQRQIPRMLCFVCLALGVGWVSASVFGDKVQMQNGDVYVGKVLSLNTATLVLQSPNLGRLQLPRGNVAAVAFEPAVVAQPSAVPARTNSSRQLPAAAPTNANPELSALFRQMGASTNLIQQVQKQFLSAAGPEANARFNELLNGLMSGSLNVADIRAQAKSAAEQLRSLKQEAGEGAGWMADGYLAILNHFLKETASLEGAGTNAAPRPPLTPEADPDPEPATRK